MRWSDGPIGQKSQSIRLESATKTKMGLVTKPTATGSGHLVDDAFFVRLGCVCVCVWV